jgi:hypothetical protein
MTTKASLLVYIFDLQLPRHHICHIVRNIGSTSELKAKESKSNELDDKCCAWIWNSHKNISKRLAKLFHKVKYNYFVRKILSNRVLIFLSIFSHSLFRIFGYLNLASRVSSHPYAHSLWYWVQRWRDIFILDIELWLIL